MQNQLVRLVVPSSLPIVPCQSSIQLYNLHGTYCDLPALPPVMRYMCTAPECFCCIHMFVLEVEMNFHNA